VDQRHRFHSRHALAHTALSAHASARMRNISATTLRSDNGVSRQRASGGIRKNWQNNEQTGGRQRAASPASNGARTLVMLWQRHQHQRCRSITSPPSRRISAFCALSFRADGSTTRTRFIARVARTRCVFCAARHRCASSRLALCAMPRHHCFFALARGKAGFRGIAQMFKSSDIALHHRRACNSIRFRAFCQLASPQAPYKTSTDGKTSGFGADDSHALAGSALTRAHLCCAYLFRCAHAAWRKRDSGTCRLRLCSRRRWRIKRACGRQRASRLLAASRRRVAKGGQNL